MGLATMIVDTIWEYLQYKLYRNNGGSAEHLLGRSSILHASAKKSTMGIRFFFSRVKVIFLFASRNYICRSCNPICRRKAQDRLVVCLCGRGDVRRKIDSSSAYVVPTSLILQ